MAPLKCVQMGPALGAPVMETMNFLNEAAARYPAAISFAAGRPPDAFVDSSAAQRWIERFVDYRATDLGRSRERVWRELGQYGDTNGMIADVIARWLERDEGLLVDPRAIMVTNGFQEALLVALLGLFDRERDVVIAEDPSYVGLAGAAAIAGVPVEPLPVDRPILEATAAAIEAVRRRGRVPRAVYVIPDHSNPSGRCLTLSEREGLLRLAREEGLLVLEDSAYRAFAYEGDPLPSLKALDDGGNVVCLGSFAKVFMPGVRLGFLVADQLVEGEGTVAQALSKVKSFVSVLTSPVTQAIVGGLLVENEFSLKPYYADKVAECGRRRAHLLASLARVFGGSPELAGRVRWNQPTGGFFVVVTLPFEFGRQELVACAGNYGVIVSPMSFFALRGGFRNQVRLAFSNASPDEIDQGVERFQKFVRDGMAARRLDA
jgi:(S)-3,5-dihydroxyphenylglycine transaminase